MNMETPAAEGGKLHFFYGTRQVFRRRHGDVNILGRAALPLPVRRSEWSLNGAAPVHFYIERDPGPEAPARYPWGTRTPAVNRLRDDPGAFNIEIPVGHPALREGENRLSVAVEGQDCTRAEAEVSFTWDPVPVPLPLRSAGWSADMPVQEVGQAVDGIWEIEAAPEGGGAQAALRPRPPAGHDILFILGGLHGSQEATYTIRFGAPLGGVFLGLSDFFFAHDAQEPELGIKPGYSTAGLATLTPSGHLQCWQGMGDSTMDKSWAWVRRSRPAKLAVATDVPYRVRHQVLFSSGNVLSRVRIWPAAGAEPADWQCSVDSFGVPAGMPRPDAGAFGLFQYQGTPTHWSDLQVRAIDVPVTQADQSRRPLEESPLRFLEGLRPAVRRVRRLLRGR
jgi:hypothetical protein